MIEQSNRLPCFEKVPGCENEATEGLARGVKKAGAKEAAKEIKEREGVFSLARRKLLQIRTRIPA
ncbi:hypothetical protein [Comamonas odontotermitis]|uniref:hypothetical protein n=1 Tax=Comamonas odontotermitis TaxID=379895 RepID=UPI0037500BA4